jgi:hypothetical protein
MPVVGGLETFGRRYATQVIMGGFLPWLESHGYDHSVTM